jgi:O-antigen ligase
MLNKYIDLELYQDNRDNTLRINALVLTSLIPLFLLFSRVAADIAVTVTGLLFLAHCIKTKEFKFIKDSIVATLFVLWIWFMIGSFFAYTNAASSFAMSFVFIRFVLFFCSCTNWIFTEIRPLKFAAKIITATLVIVAIDCLIQFWAGFSISGREQVGGRLTSFLRRPDVGIYLAKLIFPITGFWLWSAINTQNRRNLFLSSALLLAVICIISITGERTATALSLMALGLILFVIGINNKALRIYMIAAITSTITLFSVIVYYTPFIYKRALDFASDIGNFQASLYGQLFKASILSWKEYGLITGVGIRKFREVCPVFKDSGIITYCDLHSHNLYLEILSESGLVGFVLFATFVALCVYKILQSLLGHENLGVFVANICALGGLVTILFPFSVTMSFITNWSGSLNWLGISLCISMAHLTRHRHNKVDE